MADVVVVTEVQPEPPAKIALGGADQGLAWGFFDIVLSTGYPTGGSSIALNRFGLTSVMFFSAKPQGGLVPVWDYTNNKLLVYRDSVAGGVLVETTNTTNISTTTIRAFILGKP